MTKYTFGESLSTEIIIKKLQRAFENLFIPLEFSEISVSKHRRLADFQCNGLLAYANSKRVDPKGIALKVAEMLSSESEFTTSVADPGFLNFSISNTALIAQLNSLNACDKCLQAKPSIGHRVFIDYGGPNIAKEMHVGHLRSALIGQALADVFKFCGYDVISDVHLGDWGLQMGLTIAQIQSSGTDHFNVNDLGEIYPLASNRAKSEPDFLEIARNTTALLQAGDPIVRQIWAKIVSTSISAIKRTYGRLGVDFDLWNGESIYQVDLPCLVSSLESQGIARNSDGALIIRTNGLEEAPLILRTSKGSFGYAATDLAALASRVKNHNPDTILYVVDKRQALHFKQVISAAKVSQLVYNTSPEHVPFGTINGEGGRPFKTRDGGTMRLWDLLELMQSKAAKRITERSKDIDVNLISETVAMAAIKYGELSHDRENDYTFDPEAFLQFEGNTGPYLLYTSVRTTSLLNRAKENGIKPGTVKSIDRHARNIVLIMDMFSDTLQRVIEHRKPSILAAHLYSLASEMNVFYQKNPVLAKGVISETAQSRLRVLEVADKQLRVGLTLLGIIVPEKM